MGLILHLRRVTPPGARRAVWLAALALLAAGAMLGSVAHGLALSAPTVEALWQPLYLALGGSVALFVVGAIADWRGLTAARRALPVMLVVAAGFYLATRWRGGDFRVFVAYETAALLFALAVYAGLHRHRRLAGAGAIGLAFAVSLVGGAVQAGGRASLEIGWPLDHNGIFHLIQLAGLALLGHGLRRALQEPTR
ncbi:MAG TPA: hypothetical protein VLA95_02450 [Gemmatimonadales bacterium]|nr:hypothetical protein [Gemmatimonadales bacterium]